MGIKMDSNKQTTMEQNEEHIMMNILIYHACKTNLRMRSYGMLNRAKIYSRKIYRCGEVAGEAWRGGGEVAR